MSHNIRTPGQRVTYTPTHNNTHDVGRNQCPTYQLCTCHNSSVCVSKPSGLTVITNTGKSENTTRKVLHIFTPSSFIKNATKHRLIDLFLCVCKDKLSSRCGVLLCIAHTNCLPAFCASSGRDPSSELTNPSPLYQRESETNEATRISTKT